MPLNHNVDSRDDRYDTILGTLRGNKQTLIILGLTFLALSHLIIVAGPTLWSLVIAVFSARPIESLTAVIAISILTVSAWMIVSGQKGSKRFDLGVGLLTGAIISFAVLAVQVAVDSRAQDRLERTQLLLTLNINDDLSHIDLHNENLPGLYLPKKNLSGAILCGTDLESAVLGEARLDGAHLIDTNLKEANLIQATAIGAEFRRSDLRGASLGSSNLARADIKDTDFSEAQISRSDLSHSSIWGSSFKSADLYGTNLSGARLVDVKFQDAKLAEANLSNIRVPHGPGGVHEGLGPTDPISPELCGQTNSKKYPVGASFADSVLKGADLRGADLRGANLNNVADWEDAVYDETTQWPADFEPEDVEVRLPVGQQQDSDIPDEGVQN